MSPRRREAARPHAMARQGSSGSSTVGAVCSPAEIVKAHLSAPEVTSTFSAACFHSRRVIRHGRDLLTVRTVENELPSGSSAAALRSRADRELSSTFFKRHGDLRLVGRRDLIRTPSRWIVCESNRRAWIV